MRYSVYDFMGQLGLGEPCRLRSGLPNDLPCFQQFQDGRDRFVNAQLIGVER